tara:strand:- start:5873 stop:6073 length:201 start_codon:yes stop_codon:yes gene_type:complete
MLNTFLSIPHRIFSQLMDDAFIPVYLSIKFLSNENPNSFLPGIFYRFNQFLSKQQCARGYTFSNEN